MEKKCGLEVAMLIAPNRSDDSFSSRFIGTSGVESFFNASPEMYPLLDKFEIYTKNRYLGKICSRELFSFYLFIIESISKFLLL